MLMSERTRKKKTEEKLINFEDWQTKITQIIQYTFLYTKSYIKLESKTQRI